MFDLLHLGDEGLAVLMGGLQFTDEDLDGLCEVSLGETAAEGCDPLDEVINLPVGGLLLSLVLYIDELDYVLSEFLDLEFFVVRRVGQCKVWIVLVSSLEYLVVLLDYAGQILLKIHQGVGL